jgi:hypothetical protein
MRRAFRPVSENKFSFHQPRVLAGIVFAEKLTVMFSELSRLWVGK